MKILHITHNDMDAVGCDVVLRVRYRKDDITTKFCSIGSQDDIIKNEINNMVKSLEKDPKFEPYELIVVSDLSIRPETYYAIDGYLKEVVQKNTPYRGAFIGFDHHETNNMNEITSDFIVEKERLDPLTKEIIPISATKLMYMYYSETIKRANSALFIVDFDHFVNSVSRYDTWVWKNNTKVVDAYTEKYRSELDEMGYKNREIVIYPDNFYSVICNKYGCTDLSNKIITKIGDNREKYLANGYVSFLYPQEFVNIYEMEAKEQERTGKKAVQSVKFIIKNEYIVGLYIPNGKFSNNVIGPLYENFPFVDYWEIYFPANKEISFRSNLDDVNVSRIAQRLYGGGGHKSASGAKNIPNETFLKLMKEFYEGSVPANILKEYEKKNQEKVTELGYYKTISYLMGDK